MTIPDAPPGDAALPDAERRPYSPPRLSCLGDIAHLVRGQGSALDDGGSGMAMAFHSPPSEEAYDPEDHGQW